MRSLTPSNIATLFKGHLPSKRGGCFYNAFTYPTKIAPETVALCLASLTRPGDTVIDPFGGSGSTAVAALLCGAPPPALRKAAAGLGLSPTWGPRNAVIYETSTFGAFAAKVMTSRLAAKEFTDAADDLLSAAERRLSGRYAAIGPDGERGEIRYVIWSEVLACPECGGEVEFFAAATGRNPARIGKMATCPHCGATSPVEAMRAVTEGYADLLAQATRQRKKRVPVWVYGTGPSGNWDRRANAADLAAARESEEIPPAGGDAPRPMEWGDLRRSGYHFGIDCLHHLYTWRNYSTLMELWRMASVYGGKVGDALKLLILSYNASHCTLMTRVVAKTGSPDFVLTGAQSGVLYVSRLPVENNPLHGIRAKARALGKAFKALEGLEGNVAVRNASSASMAEEDGSADFMFTDPPFGDFIPYAEVNQVNELWLGKTTDRESEAIISPAQGKGPAEYGRLLRASLSEAARVLKDGAFSIIVFHAAKASVWGAFQAAVGDAGYYAVASGVLGKTQSTFKQTVSRDSVRGDPLMLFRADRLHKGDQADSVSLDEVIAECIGKGETNERRIYSIYAGRCVAGGVPVGLGAKAAYSRIRHFRCKWGQNAG